MRIFLIGWLAALFISRAAAQVTVELELDQDQFLPGESLPVAVKITNRSGERLYLGEDPAWLTFAVESSDNYVVFKQGEVPVAGAFDLESSQQAIKRVNLQPYFRISKPGRYRVTATLRIKGWDAPISSPPKPIDIVNGAKIWEQDFGLPSGGGGAPVVRKYVLERANYLRQQLRLYVLVCDASESVVYQVAALGPMVSFSRTEAQIDRESRLKVLWQTGAQTFCYTVVNPDGTVAQQDTYDNFPSRPKLGVNDEGDVVVLGGTRRLKPSEYPDVKAPNELPPMPPPPAPPPVATENQSGK